MTVRFVFRGEIHKPGASVAGAEAKTFNTAFEITYWYARFQSL